MKSDLILKKENPSTPNEASENLFPSPRTSQNTKHIDTDIMSLKMIRLRQCIDSPTTTQIIKCSLLKNPQSGIWIYFKNCSSAAMTFSFSRASCCIMPPFLITRHLQLEKLYFVPCIYIGYTIYYLTLIVVKFLITKTGLRYFEALGKTFKLGLFYW